MFSDPLEALITLAPSNPVTTSEMQKLSFSLCTLPITLSRLAKMNSPFSCKKWMQFVFRLPTDQKNTLSCFYDLNNYRHRTQRVELSQNTWDSHDQLITCIQKGCGKRSQQLFWQQAAQVFPVSYIKHQTIPNEPLIQLVPQQQYTVVAGHWIRCKLYIALPFFSGSAYLTTA